MAIKQATTVPASRVTAAAKAVRKIVGGEGKVSEGMEELFQACKQAGSVDAVKALRTQTAKRLKVDAIHKASKTAANVFSDVIGAMNDNVNVAQHGTMDGMKYARDRITGKASSQRRRQELREERAAQGKGKTANKAPANAKTASAKAPEAEEPASNVVTLEVHNIPDRPVFVAFQQLYALADDATRDEWDALLSAAMMQDDAKTA